jgi:hypothetical protein
MSTVVATVSSSRMMCVRHLCWKRFRGSYSYE